MHRLLCQLSLLIVLGLAPTVFQARDSAVACAADLPWNYDTPVEPAPRPAWMEKCVLICEDPWVDSKREAVKPHIRRLKDAGFVVMNMYPDGFCRLYAPAADDKWPQQCLEETRAMHAQGMKVLAGVYPFVGSRGPRDLLIAHPEWRLRKNDTIPESPGNGCLLSPFGEAVIELLVARIREFDVDGFQFDGWYQCEFCRCPSCLAAYKQETGEEVPPKMDIADLAYLRYMVWRDKKLLERMVQLRKAVHAVKKDAVLVNWNNRDAGRGVPSWMPESLNAEVDWVNKEWWDSYDVSAVWLAKRLRGSAGDRPAGLQPYMFMRQGYDVQSGVYHGSSAPSEEVFYRMHKILATGSIPIIWPGARQAWTDADSDRMSRDLVDFLPLVQQTRTLKYAACLDSLTTLAMARQNPKQGEVFAHRGGVARALLEAHIPFDVLSEHNITAARLSSYKVFILPNTACMSDRLVNLVRQYVAAGGGLVATYESSLYDEWGDRRQDFALKDLFGAGYVARAAIGPSRIGFAKQSHEITDDPAIRRLTGARGKTTYWGKYAAVEQFDPTMTAPLTGISVPKEQGDRAHGAPWTPLLIGNRGAGRVAYFPAAMDAAYYEAGYPYERMLLVNAVRWSAGAAPEVRVVAPMCVQAEYLTQQVGDTRRTIVHLLNDINTTTGHGSQEEKSYSIREELVSLSGLKVVFYGLAPNRVFCIPGNQQLDGSQTAEGWSVDLPPLALHCAVVAEYRQ